MMNPYERHLSVINNQEPDKVDVVFALGLRGGPTHGMLRRLTERGMGITHIVPPYKPMFLRSHVNPFTRILLIPKELLPNGVWRSSISLKPRLVPWIPSLASIR